LRLLLLLMLLLPMPQRAHFAESRFCYATKPCKS
jgi:hypothetical protein